MMIFFPFVRLVRTKMLKWFNSQMNCQFSSCNEKRSIRAWQQESFISVSVLNVHHIVMSAERDLIF